MTDRALKIYQGEDLAPVTDLTDMAIWETSEWGSRAYLGEASSASVTIRDENGVTGSSSSLPAGLTAISLAAGNTLEFTHGSNVLWRGRMASKNYSRGAERGGRYREAEAYLEDINIDTRGIVVHGWLRPTESDVDRAQALVAAYLSGSPRPSTIVNGSNLVVTGSNTVVMPAKTYNQTDVESVLAEIAGAANKTYYLLPRRHTSDAHTAELVYDGNDAVVERCPFHITDREDEVRTSPDHYFYPIFNVGPAATENGQELISGVWLFYGAGDSDYVHVADDTQANLYIHREIVIYDDTISTAAQATRAAQAILAFRKYEERTINVSIGPLTDAHVGVIRQGQTIGIKSHAIPFADDLEYEGKISNFTLTTYAPGRYFAHLQIDRPMRVAAYGTGTKPGPHGPDAGCTDLTGGAEIVTFAEGSDSGHWNSNSAFGQFSSDLDNNPPRVGASMVGYNNVLSPENNFMYYAFTGTFTAGKHYTFGVYVKTDKTEDMTMYFGATDAISTSLPAVFTADSVTQVISDADGTWKHYEIEWTPTTTIVADGSNATAINVRWGLDSTGSAGGTVLVDGGTLLECGDAAAPPASDDSTGDPGDDSDGCFSPCNHKHPVPDHGNLTGLTDDDHTQYTKKATLTTKGDLYAASAAATPARVGVGTDGQVLTADAASAAGVKWATSPSGFTNPMTTQDDIIVGGASGAAGRLAKGTDGQVLTVDPTTHHLVWATPSGAGGSLTVEEVDGSPTDSAVTKIIFPNGTLSITSHEATYTPAGGGGGLTQAYIGYNSIGASWASAVGGSMYLVPFTLTEGRTIASISAYWKGNSSNVPSWRAAVLSDSAGSPSQIVAASIGAATTLYMDSNGRWMALAIGEYFAAGSYWLAVQPESSVLSLAYDTNTSSTHRTYDVGAYFLKDPSLGGNGIVDPDKDFSIRANTLR